MKILKNRLFLVLITTIIVGSISAYAAIQINANQISYDNTNSGLESTNVQGALNELYEKSENTKEEPTLLWTNPNPTVTFAPQTLNIDTSEYSCLMFKVMSLINSEAYGHVYYIVNPIEVGVAQLLGTTYGGNSVGTGGRYSRMYIVKSDGSLEFSRGEGDGTANNSFSVPLEIYGLKKSVFPEE